MNRRNMLKVAGMSIVVSSGLGGILCWENRIGRISYRQLESKRLVLAEIAETIIPETDTPGAKSAGVVDYLLLVFSACFSKRGQWVFYQGIVQIEKEAERHFGRSFLVCTSQEREKLLQRLESEETFQIGLWHKIKRKLMGAPFFDLLKEHVVKGYCTSEMGATKGLAYQAVPIFYKSCIPYHHGQKAWATF